MSNPHGYEPGFTVEQHRDELIERLGDAFKMLAKQSATIQRLEAINAELVSTHNTHVIALATASETVERLTEALRSRHLNDLIVDCKYRRRTQARWMAEIRDAALTQPAAKEVTLADCRNPECPVGCPDSHCVDWSEA